MEPNIITKNVAFDQNDQISPKELVLKFLNWYKYLVAKWKIILLVSVVGAVIGFSYASFKKPIYTASCTFVLDEGKPGGGLSQYAGLAAMAGINIGGGASDGLFQGDNILELYRSRTMLRKTLLSQGIFDEKKELLIDRYIRINDLRERWAKSKNPALKNLSFNVPTTQFTRLNDSVISVVVDDIKRNYLTVGKPDKKLTIVEVLVNSKDENFAKVFNNAVVENVNRFYIETKTKKAADNLYILQKQVDSVRSILNRSIGGTAEAMDANPNPNLALQILRVPSLRRQVDVQANSAIYAELVKNLEMAKISMRQETPLIQVIDAPVLPLEVTKFGKLKGLVIGGLVGIFFSIAVVLFRKLVIIYFKN